MPNTAYVSLSEAVERAGYYPSVVLDVLSTALAGEEVRDHLVHVETTLAHAEVLRHITVLVLTDSRLVVTHVDDHPPATPHARPSAAATTEAVALAAVTSVVVTYGVTNPQEHRVGQTPSEVTLGIMWGAVSRIDLGPADCGDPQCEGDHGYTGTLSPDDIMVRVSAEAEGTGAVEGAVRFATTLSGAIARHRAPTGLPGGAAGALGAAPRL